MVGERGTGSLGQAYNYTTLEYAVILSKFTNFRIMVVAFVRMKIFKRLE